MRTLLVGVVLAGFFVFPSAQDANAQFPEEVGMKGGVTSAGISEDATSRRIGGQFLLYAEWLDASFFSIVTEAGYTQRGFKGEPVFPRGAPNGLTIDIEQLGKASARLDYLTTSLLGKASVSVLGAEPYVLAGFRLDKLLNREAEVSELNNDAFSGQVKSNSLSSTYKSVAYGLTGGVGVTFSQIASARISLEARYDRDLSDSVAGFEAPNYSDGFLGPYVGPYDPDVRNEAFTMMLGIGF